jgi:type VI secretion system protein ImpG
MPFRHLEWSGYRLLREYFIFPDAFLFFRLSGFESFMADITGHSMEVAITLSATEESLENNIDGNSFAIYCTPVINLF